MIKTVHCTNAPIVKNISSRYPHTCRYSKTTNHNTHASKANTIHKLTSRINSAFIVFSVDAKNGPKNLTDTGCK